MKTIQLLIVSAVATLMLVSGSLQAQVQAKTEVESMKVTLANALEYATKNFKDAKNAELDKQITKYQTIEIITEGLPQVTGAFNYQNNFKLQTNVIPAGVFGPNEVRVQFGNPFVANTFINVDQLIVDGRYFLGLKANKAFVELSDKQAELTSVNIKVNVTKAYYGYLLNAEVEKLLQSNLQIANTLLKETEAYYNAGLREELDVDKLKLNVAQVESQIEIAKFRTTVSINTLKYLMGLPLTTQIEISEKLEDFLSPEETIAEEEKFDPKSRLEYKLLQTQYDIRGYDKKRFGLGYMPALYGNFNYGVNTFNQKANVFNGDWFSYGSLGVSLQVPLFDSYKKGAQFQQKKLEQQKIKNNIDEFESSSKIDVENKMQAYYTSIENYKNQKKNYALAEKIYNTARIKYNNGVGNSVELAQSESSYTEAQSKFLQAKADVLISKTDLDKALGKIK